MTQIADHPLRLALSELMHERALPVLAAPLALRSWVLLVDDADRAAETAWVNRLGDGAEGRLARIEAQAGQPRSNGEAAARHEALKSRVAASLTQLDQLIESLEQ